MTCGVERAGPEARGGVRGASPPLLPNTSLAMAPMPPSVPISDEASIGISTTLEFGALPSLCGIVTDGDIARNLTRNLAAMTVDEVMTRTPKTVRKETLATGAMALLQKHNISALIVVDDENFPVGLVHFHDLLRIGVA